MRFDTIVKRINELEFKERAAGRHHREDNIARRCDYVLYQAIQNAEDTATERDITKKEYEQVVMSSLEVLLCASNEPDVQAWYRKQGFTW